ncbi:MAG: hypothetical protein ABJ205_08780 [Erythrobacter sp.]|uniref:hypothetical protein n=1 Tax=Erythrobacter sp. TaxID=1042 RepID=UPI00326616FD
MTEDRSRGDESAPQGAQDSLGASDDLKAIRRDRELVRDAEARYLAMAPRGAKITSDIRTVAEAAADWPRASLRHRLRALRVLVRRLGLLETRYLAILAEEKSIVPWLLTLRDRPDAQMLDGGRERKKREQDFLDSLVGQAVYSLIKKGASKQEAIEAVKEDYRIRSGAFSNLRTDKRFLPDRDGIEKWLGRFRKGAIERGYIDPFTASPLFSSHEEPDLKIKDLPKRGRPRKK